MVNKKHTDTKRFFIGAAVTLAVWIFGVFSAGRIPWIFDDIQLIGGSDLLSRFFPFFLVIYSVTIAILSKRKFDKSFFLGSYSFLLIPSVAFLFLWINQYLNLDLENYISFVLLLLFVPAMPVLSSFEGFLKAFYGNIRPAGFSQAHIIFCIVLVAASVFSPIVYKLVKSE